MKLKMNLKLSKDASKSIVTSDSIDISNEVKIINTEIEQSIGSDTIKNIIPELAKFGEETVQIRQKIILTQKIIEKIQLQPDSNSKIISLKKHYILLKQYFQQGYKIIMKLREYVTKEKMGYAIRASDGKVTDLGIFDIDSMLNMTTLTKNSKGKFSLAFKHIENINKIFNTPNKVNFPEINIGKDSNGNLITLKDAILRSHLKIRKNVIDKRSSLKQQLILEKKYEEANQIKPYEWGTSGFALERTFIAYAKKEINIDSIDNIQRDADRYSSGGDLQKGEVHSAFKKMGYNNLEVKNITSAGAGLVALDTLIKDLDKVIEICFNKNGKTYRAVSNKLKREIFKNPGKIHVIENDFIKNLNNIIDKEVNKYMSNLFT